MRLLSPWALVGLIAIAGPIAAHLLARRPPKTLRFPNLRFLPPTVPTPVKRHRLADHGLLMLRIAIIALAAFALAGPTRSGSSGTSGSSGSSGLSGPTGPATPTTSVGASSRELTLLTAASDRASADAALAAAVQQGAPKQVVGDRDVALVFPGFETRESLLKAAAPLSQPWMSDLYTTLATDPLVQAAAERLNRTPLELLKATGDRTRPERLLVFVDAPAQSLFATAAVSAILRSVPSGAASADSVPLRSASSGPSSVDSVPLRSAPSGTSSVTSVSSVSSVLDAEEPPSFARFVWLAIGILLLAETLLRRRRPASLQREEHARVA